MSFSVILLPDALRDLEKFPEPYSDQIQREIKKYLTHEPYRPIKTRIKKLHHLNLPLYRLRVGDYRVYYQIQQNDVVVLAVLHKKESDRWLKSIR